MKQLPAIPIKGRKFLPIITLIILALVGVSHAGDTAMVAAKAHVGSSLAGDLDKLAKTYAPRLTLMPGHEYLKEKYGLAGVGGSKKGALVERGKLLAAMGKAAAARKGLPKEHVERISKKLKYESIKVREGDFTTVASDRGDGADDELHFKIKKGDALIKVSPPKGDFVLLQMRMVEGAWTVVSEYLD